MLHKVFYLTVDKVKLTPTNHWFCSAQVFCLLASTPTSKYGIHFWFHKVRLPNSTVALMAQQEIVQLKVTYLEMDSVLLRSYSVQRGRKTELKRLHCDMTKGFDKLWGDFWDIYWTEGTVSIQFWVWWTSRFLRPLVCDWQTVWRRRPSVGALLLDNTNADGAQGTAGTAHSQISFFAGTDGAAILLFSSTINHFLRWLPASWHPLCALTFHQSFISKRKRRRCESARGFLQVVRQPAHIQARWTSHKSFHIALAKNWIGPDSH